jgi:chaperonin GroEL (HSP60 family)
LCGLTKIESLAGIERIAAVTGGEIASTFDKPELVKLGKCALIDEVMIGEDKLIRFSGCAGGQACTIVLRGASSHLLGTIDRYVTFIFISMSCLHVFLLSISILYRFLAV